MKTPTTKNRNYTPRRCLFGFAALVLLAPQLSYKFYVFANNPAWRYKYHFSGFTSPSGAATRVITLNDQHCRTLSLDKRFDLKLPITLARGEAVVERCWRRAAVVASHPALSVSRCCRAARPLRGPPSTISHLSIFI